MRFREPLVSCGVVALLAFAFAYASAFAGPANDIVDDFIDDVMATDPPVFGE